MIGKREAPGDEDQSTEHEHAWGDDRWRRWSFPPVSRTSIARASNPSKGEQPDPKQPGTANAGWIGLYVQAVADLLRWQGLPVSAWRNVEIKGVDPVYGEKIFYPERSARQV
jgi:hypothetical protein